MVDYLSKLTLKYNKFTSANLTMLRVQVNLTLKCKFISLVHPITFNRMIKPFTS